MYIVVNSVTGKYMFLGRTGKQKLQAWFAQKPRWTGDIRLASKWKSYDRAEENAKVCESKGYKTDIRRLQ